MRHGQGDELWFAGRKMDLIIRGGANISPVEIEAVVKSHTAVRAAAVFGIPDSALGQRVANHRLAEIPLPILLVFGLAIRLAALGLLVMTWSWS
jgi:non-ribosomal peptide synthetase component E (peptide arylation enzyme)